MEALTYAEQALKPEISRAACGQTGLGELYDAHAGAVYRLLLALLGAAADAQDALSETFLNLARQDLRRIRHPRAYLLTSARRQALLMLRRRRRETPADPADFQFFEAKTLNQDKLLFAQHIEAALLTLPIEQREVIVLKVYEGMTFAEIAKITKMRPNTVASRYRYAIEKLREMLKEK
jgi:RNA polymerase sigma-70 factor (ECF subfamily)